MSKQFAAALVALPLILQIFNNCFGQGADVTVTIRSVSPPIAEIRGRNLQSSTNHNFSLLRSYAGFANLADRISDIRLEGKEGLPVAFRQFVPGEYVASGDFQKWSYKVDLSPNKKPAANAHISWLGPDSGLLFLDDLLPLTSAKQCGPIKLHLQMPEGWTTYGNDSVDVTCSDKPVYFLSRRSRLTAINVPEPVDILISSDWKFTDQQAADFAKEIFSAYGGLFGGYPVGRKHIFVLPFPVAIGQGSWEADTRGNTVTILSSDMPFQTQSVQRLHEQLRHELFHLWIPNGIHLTGNYDWFYEGFALYESLRLGVGSNRLSFNDFLDTLGRAMTIDGALADHFSLIAASNSRTSGDDTRLYARGILIAFLTDLKMLSRSNGKRNIEELLRSLYEKYQDQSNETDANQAIFAAINDLDIERCVVSGEPIIWASVLNAFGIEKLDRPGASTLSVKADLSGSQKKLLDKLGYNNWRKSSVGPK